MTRLVACPVCGRELVFTEIHVFDFMTGRGRSTWSRCRNCRSYFDVAPFNRETEVNHTRTCSWGRPETGVRLSLFKRRMYLSVLRLLNRHVQAKRSILDVGCSFGGFLEQARIQGFATRGMDIVPEAVHHVREQGFPCELAASIEELSIPDGSVEILSVLDCNYYWPDQRTELRAAWKKLRPSGFMVMRLVDKSWMLTAGLAIRKFFPVWGESICTKAVNDHRVSIPLASMLRLLQEEHFQIVYASSRGAMHSDESSLAVKASFAIGVIVWHLTGWNVAPGALVLTRKPA